MKRIARAIAVLVAVEVSDPMHGQTISSFRELSTQWTGEVRDAAADPSGALYLIWDAGVRKFDTDGNELWTRAVSVRRPARSAAADSSGVYVAGFIEQRTGQFSGGFVQKHSAGGDELWTREFEFQPLGGPATDSTGVYVAGTDYNTAYVRKYGTDGAELWTKRFGQIKTASGVAVDATGIYVRVNNSNGAAGITVYKFDGLGNELWVRELNQFDVSRLDKPKTFVANAAGFYLLAADARGGGHFLRKYASNGNELWSRSAPGGTMAMDVDATGVYLVGTTGTDSEFVVANLPGHCQSGADGESFALKYDPNGGEVWVRQFGTHQGGQARGVAVNAGGAYVAGETGGADGFRSAWELFQPFEGFAPENSAAFLTKFEKSPALMPNFGPRISPGCVVNAASYLGGAVAPGEMVTIFGSEIGPSQGSASQLTAERRLATNLSDTRILFNSVAAPLVYVSDKQSTTIVPFSVAGRRTVDVQVEYKGVRSNAVTMPVIPARPGIFSLDGSGRGQGAILNEDGSVNSPSNPARRGSVISIFATGGGEAAAGVVEGQILGDVLPRPGLPVRVFFDLGNNEHQVQQKQAEVLYAGGVSGAVAGLLQINVRVPANAETIGRAVQFALFVGWHWAMYYVTVALQ